jgi:glutamate--cysteine ligase
MVTALTALWRGVLYDAEARTQAHDLLADLTGAESLKLHEDVGLHGLAARAKQGPVSELAAALLDVATAGLGRLAGIAATSSEATLLDPLRAVLDEGRTPAERLLEAWRARGAHALAPTC